MEMDITLKSDLRALLNKDLLLESEIVNRDLDRRVKLLFHNATSATHDSALDQIAEFLLETYKSIHVMHGHYIFGVTASGGMVMLINSESSVSKEEQLKSL